MSFQFHKGTIKTLGRSRCHHSHQHFNSIKVQLKQPNLKSPSASTVFQFHKGTIKTHHVRYPSAPIPLFQFHKGTIKTDLFTGVLPTPQLFQFHKGTIKTCLLVACKVACKDFNSIKVQLKQE